MRIGVLGLGNIARKAYLPVITAIQDIELVFATRNREMLNNLAEKYRIKEKVSSVDGLIEKGVEAAFVHASTDAHIEIAEKLLSNGIHVYIDKPISYNLEESRRLIKLAERKNLKFIVGFNRRFVPFYKKLKSVPGSKIIIMEKNRTYIPANIRKTIYDDFIHVVDTLRFLSGKENYNYSEIDVNGIVKNGNLLRVMLTIHDQDNTLVGIMNRDSGITEETVEVLGFKEKVIVKNLTSINWYKNGEEKIIKSGVWNPTLYNRGFIDIVDWFINVLKKDIPVNDIMQDALVTHEICEGIIQELNRKVGE